MGASRKREGLAPKFSSLSLSGWGGAGTPLQEANREVPLDGVAFSRLEPDYNGVAFSIDLLEWGRKFSDFGVSKDSKWEDSRLKKSESCCLLNLTISSH